MGTFADNNAKFLYRELVQRFGKRAKMEVRTVHRYYRRPLSVQDLQDIKTKLRNIGAGQLPPRNDLRKWEEVLQKKGLWANIHAKRKRGEKPAKEGDEEYPDAESWQNLTKKKPNKGKRFVSKKGTSYGQAGKAKDGKDRIQPNNKTKADAYCARSNNIKGNWRSNPDSPNNLSRKKWKCHGNKSSR